MRFLDEPTVFILGAGASKPYGFPLGPDLKTHLLERTVAKSTRKSLKELGFDEPLIDSFRDALRFGVHTTIDTFLERKRNFRELGSYLIASTIMPMEKHEALFPQKDWYGTLFKMLSFEDDTPSASHLSIVTLNYDRSLEHFLRMNIDYNCRHDRVDFAHTKRRQIRFVHAHGCLGRYPDVMYGTGISDVNALRAAASSIKIVSDRLDDSPDFLEAQKIIADAKCIVIMGFGYNETTLSALMSQAKLDGVKCFGTAYGFNSDGHRKIKEYFNNRITLGAPGEGCNEFLKETVYNVK